MIIKPSSFRESLFKALLSALVKSWLVRWAFFVGVITLTAFGVTSLVHDPENDFSSAENNPEILEAGRAIFKYKPSLSRPERIEIAVSDADFRKLAREREEALRAGVLVTSGDSFVPAKIRHEGKDFSAKLRLKGDWVDHLKGPKWSYRISLKNGDVLFGMRECSIQHPARRNFIKGWLFHEVMRREGILALRIKLVEVTLNGKNLGTYYLEEHFDKTLIEHQHYREGPIVKFNEDVLWMDRKRAGGESIDDDTAYYSSAIDLFQPGSISRNTVLRDGFVNAFNLLERFRNGELKAEQVFDVGKMARYYALADLLGSSHMAYFHNLRFYYNPVTSRLEPIAFDADAGKLITTLMGSRVFEKHAYFDFDRTIFSDREFYDAYLHELERVSYPGYLEELIASTDEELQRQVNILHKEYPAYVFYTNFLTYNRAFILRALHPYKPFNAYRQSADTDHLTLRVGNIQYLPVRLLGLAYNRLILYRPPELVLLPGKDPAQPVDYQSVTFAAVGNVDFPREKINELKAVYQMTPDGDPQTADIEPFDAYQENFMRDDFMRQPANYEEFPFIVKNPDRPILFIRPGVWTLDKNLIIPAGFVLIAKEGTTLDLTKGAKILSYSPVYLTGTTDSPVVIKSIDGTGQGLAVIGTAAAGRSRLEHAIFENLSAPSQNGWSLTGAVTFYEAPVDIVNSVFIRNHTSDDALNLIRSEFTISGSVFSQAFADALDLDFSNGSIINTRVVKAGNDGIDFSGCVATVNDLTVEGAGDKGLSVGERSRVEAVSVTVSDAATCITSKDDSLLILEEADISRCKIGLAAYQKKPEYERTGQIQISGIKYRDLDQLAVTPDMLSIKIFRE